jgi:hypothetical protein
MNTLNIKATNNITTMTNLNNKHKNCPHYLVIQRMLFVYEVYYRMHFSCTWKNMCSQKPWLFFGLPLLWEVLSYSFQTQMELYN